MEIELDWDFLGKNSMIGRYDKDIEYKNANLNVYIYATKFVEHETNSSSIDVRELYVNIINLYDEEGNDIYDLNKEARLIQDFKETLTIG